MIFDSRNPHLTFHSYTAFIPIHQPAIERFIMKSPAIVQKGPAPVIVQEPTDFVPDFLKPDTGRNYGMESLDNSDLAIPQLQLLQGLSPALKQFSFLSAGDFFHTATEQALPQPFLATVIYIDKRYILWRPRDMGGGILARANDGKHWHPANTTFAVKLDKKDGGANVTWETADTVEESGLAEWGTQDPNNPDSPPAATLMYNLLLAFPASSELSPAILTLSRTQAKSAQKLNMKFKGLNRPTFASVIRFSAFEDHRGANDFYSVKTELAGFLGTSRKWRENDIAAWQLGDEALYKRYKVLFEDVNRSGLVVKDEEELQNSGVDDITNENRF